MNEVILILLLIVTQSTDNFYSFEHIVWTNGSGVVDTEIIDEWSTTLSKGDVMFPGKAFHKAVLFKSEEALKRFLRNVSADGAWLIDLRDGSRKQIKQKEVKKSVTKLEHDYYEFELSESEGGK